jgi:hypothetical protein
MRGNPARGRIFSDVLWSERERRAIDEINPSLTLGLSCYILYVQHPMKCTRFCAIAAAHPIIAGMRNNARRIKITSCWLCCRVDQQIAN